MAAFYVAVCCGTGVIAGVLRGSHGQRQPCGRRRGAHRLSHVFTKDTRKTAQAEASPVLEPVSDTTTPAKEEQRSPSDSTRRTHLSEGSQRTTSRSSRVLLVGSGRPTWDTARRRPASSASSVRHSFCNTAWCPGVLHFQALTPLLSSAAAAGIRVPTEDTPLLLDTREEWGEGEGEESKVVVA